MYFGIKENENDKKRGGLEIMKRRMIMLGVAITVVVALSGCGKENKNAEIGTDIADTDAEWDDAGEDTVEE